MILPSLLLLLFTTTHVFAADGDVWACGKNLKKGLQEDSAALTYNSVTALSGSTSVTQVSAGEGTLFTMTSTNAAPIWGDSAKDALGFDCVCGIQGFKTPTNIILTGGAFTGKTPSSVVMSGRAGMMVTTDGNVIVWGDNTYKQCSSGSAASCSTPANLDTYFTNANFAASSGDHSFVVTDNNEIWGWGLNSAAQLGHGDTSTYAVPTKLSTALPQVSGIAAGSGFTVFLSAGKLYTSGSNTEGCLGNGGSAASYSTPSLISQDLNNLQDPCYCDAVIYCECTSLRDATVTRIAAGSAHVMALTSTGSVFVWGSSGDGRLGLGSGLPANLLAPGQIPQSSFGGKTISAISASGATSAAIASDGTLFLWGSNVQATLCSGSSTLNVPTSSGSGFAKVSMGGTVSLFVKGSPCTSTCGNGMAGSDCSANSDGCGNACPCAANFACQSGTCQSCTPSCSSGEAGQSCGGSDGCGGTCSCEAGLTCGGANVANECGSCDANCTYATANTLTTGQYCGNTCNGVCSNLCSSGLSCSLSSFTCVASAGTSSIISTTNAAGTSVPPTTTTTTTTTGGDNANQNNDDEVVGLAPAAFYGIVAGAVICIALIVVAAIMLLRKKRQGRDDLALDYVDDKVSTSNSYQKTNLDVSGPQGVTLPKDVRVGLENSPHASFRN